jgi:uncharacterized membrane protein
MISIFSRIDFITPFSEGKIAIGISLSVVACIIWACMVAYISWIRNDAKKEAMNECYE